MEQNNEVERKLTIFEQSKINTESFIDKLEHLEVSTQEEVDFLVDKAITSAKMEIALATLENKEDCELSELAQTIKKYPDFTYSKKVIFENYISKENAKDARFYVVDEPNSIVVQDELVKKPHSQKRRKRVLLVSQKLDDCEIYVMASRLTERDIINKLKQEDNVNKKENKQKNLDEYLDR